VAVFARLRVDTIRENTRRGLDYTRGQGRIESRPTVMTAEHIETADRVRAEHHSFESIGRVLGWEPPASGEHWLLPEDRDHRP